MARRCETCAHFRAEMFPMCSAPQRDGQRIVIAYFARSAFKDDCGPAGAWHQRQPSLLRRILERLRGAA
ncbi:hypothetical protein [Cupriavidus necator]